MVHGARRVDFGFELARHVGQLRARQDVEVIVRRVPARVAFSADGGAEDDEVFGYALEKMLAKCSVNGSLSVFFFS